LSCHRGHKLLHHWSKRHERRIFARLKNNAKKTLINKSVKNVSLINTVHDIKLSKSQFSHPCLSPNNMDFVSQNNNVQNTSFINSITESNKYAMNVNSDFVSGPFSSRPTNFIIDKKKYQDKLAEALIDVNHLQGNRILSIIRMHECLSYLPKDIRTLLCTPRAVPYLLKVSPGDLFPSHILILTTLRPT